MDPSLNELSQLGVMGLWTLSLLYANSKMRKDFQDRYDNMNRNMLKTLVEVHQLVESGFREMRDQSNRRRAISRLKDEI
tara:strand:+ start:1294 stop:1530 length:237 start_codon:yes stop_codon:yes gene_type:complete